MAKTFPIMLEVEEILLGPVLRKLNGMPGIAKLHLDLGHGGQEGAQKAAQQVAAAREANGSSEEHAVKLLMQGPKHIREISAAVGGSKPRAYGVMNSLKKKGMTHPIGKGMHQLTKSAMHQLGAPNARLSAPQPAPQLPAPQVKHGPAGRAAPGSGPIILRTALDAGPASSTDLRQRLADQGMSPKSISGVLDRGKKHGIIKKNGSDLYELTPKGQKIELTTEAAHG